LPGLLFLAFFVWKHIRAFWAGFFFLKTLLKGVDFYKPQGKGFMDFARGASVSCHV